MEEFGEAQHSHDAPGEGLASSIQAQMEKEHIENTKVKNIRWVSRETTICANIYTQD